MSIDDEGCEWSLKPTEEETAAAAWLMKTLTLMVERKGKNAAKAEAAQRILMRLAAHQIVLHDQIHELEGVLHSKGYAKVDDCPGCEECERKEVN